jgi:hypothetical protein
MPALEILLDESCLGTVSTEGLSVIRVDISANDADEGRVRLWVDARPVCGLEKAEGHSYIPGRELLTGQRVEVRLQRNSGAQAFTGKASRAPGSARDPASAPHRLQLELSSGLQHTLRTGPGEGGFMFSLVWTDAQPERATVRLSRLASHQSPAEHSRRQHVDASIALNQRVRLGIDA